jgi:hypothetical protein
MVDLLSTHIREKLKKSSQYKAEAQYYLEITNYNFEKAITEFEEDLKFESDQEEVFKKMKGKGKTMQPLLFLKK